jgi:hypothetical protein
MLPFQIPDSVLASMRTQAEVSMQTAVSIYNVVYAYDRYGKQVITSGLYHTCSGLLAKPTEKNWTRIRYLLDEKLAPNKQNLEQVRVLLLPDSTPEITREHIIQTAGNDWRILELDDDVTEAYSLYTRLLISKREYPTQSEIIL